MTFVPTYWDGGDVSDTLDVAGLTKGQMMPEKRRFPCVQASGVRRLTPTECERLQGLPDGFTCGCGGFDAARTILRAVSDYADAKEGRREQGLDQAAILLSRLPQPVGRGDCDCRRWEEAGAAALSAAAVQSVRLVARCESASSGQEHAEQRAGKHRVSLSVMPHEGALGGRSVSGSGGNPVDNEARSDYWPHRLPSLRACRCSDSKRYAGLGDAVTANVAHWIGERLNA